MDVMYIASRLILYMLIVAAVVQDFTCMKISNRLIITGLGVSFIIRLLGGGSKRLIWFLPDIIFPVIILYLFYLAGILGAADIKLFSVISGFTNLKYCLICILCSFIFAAGWSFIKLLVSKRLYYGLMNSFWYFKNLAGGNFTKYESECEKICFSLAIYIAVLFGDIISFF